MSRRTKLKGGKMKTKALSIATMLMFALCSYSEDEKKKPENATDTKIYVIYLGSSASYVLENVERADFMGIKCLKGRFVDMTWVKGKICYVPVDKISVINEFDSFDQYKEAIQKFRDQQMK
jgi:hypothetical protein